MMKLVKMKPEYTGAQVFGGHSDDLIHVTFQLPGRSQDRYAASYRQSLGSPSLGSGGMYCFIYLLNDDGSLDRLLLDIMAYSPSGPWGFASYYGEGDNPFVKYADELRALMIEVLKRSRRSQS